jgi:hypothetical protein
VASLCLPPTDAHLLQRRVASDRTRDVTHAARAGVAVTDLQLYEPAVLPEGSPEDLHGPGFRVQGLGFRV